MTALLSLKIAHVGKFTKHYVFNTHTLRLRSNIAPPHGTIKHVCTTSHNTRVLQKSITEHTRHESQKTKAASAPLYVNLKPNKRKSHGQCTRTCLVPESATPQQRQDSKLSSTPPRKVTTLTKQLRRSQETTTFDTPLSSLIGMNWYELMSLIARVR